MRSHRVRVPIRLVPGATRLAPLAASRRPVSRHLFALAITVRVPARSRGRRLGRAHFTRHRFALSSSRVGLIEIDDSVYLIDSDLMVNAEESNEFGILKALFFAFIGGLILNLMPCVFPVISLKVLSFVSMSGESETKIRLHSISFSLGVLISFLAIAILLIALKESGNYLGWGFQLQSPLIEIGRASCRERV